MDNNIESYLMSSDNKKNLDITLNEFIEERKVKIGDKSLTHQWWDDITNVNFIVKDNEYNDFLSIYTKELKNSDKILHVMEQPKENGPLCLDFDLKQMSPERSICVDDITQIISIVNNVIYKYFVISDRSILDSYVTMKKEPFFNKKKLNYSDGFHLQYPNLILNIVDRFLVYDESRKEIIKQDLFSEVYSILCQVNNLKKSLNTNSDDSDNYKNNNEDDDDVDDDNDNDENINNGYYSLDDKNREIINDEIFDKSVIIKNKWFMYGSGKNINNEYNLYNIAYIFDYNVDEIETIPKDKTLIKILSIRKQNNDDLVVKSKNNDNYIDKIAEIKSKYIKKPFDKLDINKLFKKKEINSSDKTIKFINEKNNKNQDDIQTAKRLVKILSPKRAGPYEDWITVGWALYNISPTLLLEFIEFSKRNKFKFDENSCLKVWDDCSKRIGSGYTIASLYKWASDDNIEGYKTFLRERINLMLDKGDIKADFDIACIIKEIYKYEYVCSSISKSIWWQFDNHKWNRIECAHTLSIKMSTDIALEFATLHHDIMKISVLETGQKADLLNRKCKDIQSLIFNLKKSSYKDRIIKECSYLFYKKDFESNLDQNNYLIGFENGVYDLNNLIFRNGCPDDMISKTVGYNYKEYSENDQLIKEIYSFIESIQPEEDMRKYLMTYCASFLEGSNKDQKFMIWIGCGMNGKGTLIDLLDNTFNGNSDGYFGSLPPTILTQKRGSSSAATPELADKFGKRVITLQEPEGDDKINVGFMKNITGQDKIEARPLYGEPFQYTPQFKLLLACNHLPNIPSDDGGTWRRIRVIDFYIKFTSNPKNKNESKSDPELREKLKFWSQGFMWILINKYYPEYKKNGLDKIEPDRVKLSTNKYKADSNVFIEFFNENLENNTDIENAKISKTEVWKIFKEWCSSAYNEKKQISQKKLIEYFENNNYKITSGAKGYIYGIIKKEFNEINNDSGLGI